MFAIQSIITELTMKGTSLTELFQSNQGNRAPWFLFWLLVGIAVLAVVIAWWMKRDEPDEEPVALSAASGDTPAAEPVAAQAVAPAAEETTEESAEEEAPAVEEESATEEGAPAEEEPAEAETTEPEAEAPVEEAKTPSEESAEEASDEPEAPPEPDDLTKMEGIGPKISGLLQEKGISTYSQLANTSVETLKQILTDGKIRIAHPETWPEQAALAAAGDWDDLEKLQDDLHGGRRKA